MVFIYQGLDVRPPSLSRTSVVPPGQPHVEAAQDLLRAGMEKGNEKAGVVPVLLRPKIPPPVRESTRRSVGAQGHFRLDPMRLQCAKICGTKQMATNKYRDRRCRSGCSGNRRQIGRAHV